MTNINYVRGRNLEYQIMNYWRKLGCFVFRTAGSRSPTDVIVVRPKSKEIIFFQAKKGTAPSIRDRCMFAKFFQRLPRELTVLGKLIHVPHGKKYDG